MAIVQAFLQLLHQFTPLAAFIAGAYAEEALLFLAVLAGQGSISIVSVAFFGFIGSLIADTVWFKIGGTHFVRRWIHKSPSKKKTPWSHTYTLSLIGSKFIYGSRGIALLYLGSKKVPLKSFLIAETGALALYYSIMLPLAWLAGAGIFYFLHVAKHLERVLLFIVLAFLAVYILYKYLSPIIVKYVSKRFN